MDPEADSLDALGKRKDRYFIERSGARAWRSSTKATEAA
jgi:hypothetical protein